MKTINIKYTNNDDLIRLIKKENILTYDNILVQIFAIQNSYESIKSLIDIVSSNIPQAKIIGATSHTNIIDNRVYQNSIISISLFETTKVETFIADNQGDSYQLGLDLANRFKDFEDIKSIISFGDGLNINGDRFLDGLSTMGDIPISGGLASDIKKFTNTYVFSENGITENGAVVAILYGDDLIVNSLYNFGWEVIGKELVVTKSIGNRVYEIDNTPIIDIYKKYLGSRIEKLLPKTAIEFPLILKENGVLVGRAVLKRHSDNSLSFAGDIKEGSVVQFGYGNMEQIIKKKYDNIHTILEYPMESIFIYSCVARLNLFQDEINKDIEPYNQMASVSGFFTFGEFFYNLDRAILFNETKTILFLSEKNIENRDIKIIKPDIDGIANTIDALAHLNTQTTKELRDLNVTLEKRVEEAIKEIRVKDEMLLQQSKLAQMGELLEMISHQWKQPLTAIATTNANILLRSQLETLSKDYLEERLNDSSEYIGYLSETINDFKDFFQNDKVKVNTNFFKIIENVKKIIYQNLLYNDIELRINFLEDNLENFDIYQNDIQQVVLNIITNAQDAIIINKIHKSYIKIDKLDNKDYFILTIEDNAGGISCDIKDKILRPYFTTKKEYGGIGIGLHISNMIMQKLNGKIEYYNISNGVRFLIYIPK